VPNDRSEKLQGIARWAPILVATIGLMILLAPFSTIFTGKPPVFTLNPEPATHTSERLNTCAELHELARTGRTPDVSPEGTKMWQDCVNLANQGIAEADKSIYGKPLDEKTAAEYKNTSLPSEFLTSVSKSPEVWMKIAVSMSVLFGSFYVVIAKSFGPAEKHFAFGFIGTVLGYWLRG
jgi:hypothetical protein